MVLFFILSYTTLAYGDRWAAFLFPEDHFIQSIQPIFMLAACAMTVYMFWRAYKNRQILEMHWLKLLVYLGLAALYFFVAGEEISWGQRIFHIETPPEQTGKWDKYCKAHPKGRRSAVII